MIAIAAVDKNGNIGNKGDLLFHIPEDMKHFRAQTLNKTVIMGRKTLDSFPNGKPLPKRRNIVLSRSPKEVDGARFVTNTDELMETIKGAEPNDVFVIGGESIYTLLLPYCDTVILTEVEAEADEADKKFPELNREEWALSEQSDLTESNGYLFRICTYKRIS